MSILLAVDYHRTLADKVGDRYVVDRSLIPLIGEFVNRGNVFAIVTSGSYRHVEEAAVLIKDAVLALENGLIIQLPGGRRITNIPEGWLDKLTSIEGEFRARGIRYSRGEATIFVDQSPEVIEIAKAHGAYVENNRGLLSILPPGVSKGYAVRILRSMYKPALTVAIGDADNDIAMLREADMAVAVRNALDSVKSIANYITSANDGEGVREVIEAALRCGVELARCLR